MKTVCIFSLLLLAMLVACQSTQHSEPAYPLKSSENQNSEKLAKNDKKASQTVNEIEEKRKEEEKKSKAAKDEKAALDKTKKASEVSELPILEPLPEKKTTETTKENKKEKAAKKGTPPVESKKFFYLRIISLEHHEYYQVKTKQIAEFLKGQGFKEAKARVSKDPKGEKYWVVDIGQFDTVSTEAAKEFKEKIRQMKYEGVQQFKDAYYIQY
jgi:outer membrane biosynthesis protein TonB